jgi:DNA polymerase V
MNSSLPSAETLKQTPFALPTHATSLALPLFVQKIPAGFPSPACDYIEEGLDLTEYLIKHKSASFYFEVAGDSMINAGIHPGDKVLVDRSVEPKHNHIVIAMIHNEYTLKRLYRWRGIVELRPENPAYQPIRLKEGEELQIWGVVTAVVRKFKV